MSYFRTAFRQALTNWRAWVLLPLAPLITLLASRLLPAEEVSTPVQVGVVLPDEGGGAFWEKLQSRSGLVVTFQAASVQQARRQVGLGRWDCALVLPQDFDERVARLDTDRLFTLLIGPGSTVYPLVRETAAACAAECVSPGIAEDYLLDSGIAAGAELEAARSRLQQSLGDSDRVLIALETADGAPLDPLSLADSGVSRLTAGLTAILLLIWALLAAMDLGRWLDSPFARRLAPLMGTFPLLLPRMAGAAVPALCAGALALLAAEDPLACVLSLVPCLLFWSAAALALARSRAAWSSLPALLPFVPAAGLLLSPVLVDLSLLFPALGPVIRWTPVTLYLRSCAGHWADGLALAAGAAAILGLLALLDRHRA